MSVAERSTRVRSTLIDRIARVDLRVRNVERSLSFYRDVVGLEVVEQSGESASLRSPEGPAFLNLTSTGVEAPADPGAAGLFHIAIRFPSKSALGDALARLAAAGMEIGAGDHAVSEALYIDDPDGNGVELYYDRPEQQWPAPTPDMIVPMVSEAVDLHGLLAAGSGEAAVGKSAATGTDMGHVHLQVADLDKTVAFYSEVLGLDLTGRLGGQAAFLSSNGYHHHVGTNTWRSRGSASAPRNRAGLTRVAFAVADRDLLEKVGIRLGEHGHQVSGEENKSLVVTDPNGVELELRPV